MPMKPIKDFDVNNLIKELCSCLSVFSRLFSFILRSYLKNNQFICYIIFTISSHLGQRLLDLYTFF